MLNWWIISLLISSVAFTCPTPGVNLSPVNNEKVYSHTFNINTIPMWYIFTIHARPYILLSVYNGTAMTGLATGWGRAAPTILLSLRNNWWVQILDSGEGNLAAILKDRIKRWEGVDTVKTRYSSHYTSNLGNCCRAACHMVAGTESHPLQWLMRHPLLRLPSLVSPLSCQGSLLYGLYTAWKSSGGGRR